jgi:hypothetical protein
MTLPSSRATALSIRGAAFYTPSTPFYMRRRRWGRRRDEPLCRLRSPRRRVTRLFRWPSTAVENRAASDQQVRRPGWSARVRHPSSNDVGFMWPAAGAGIERVLASLARAMAATEPTACLGYGSGLTVCELALFYIARRVSRISARFDARARTRNELRACDTRRAHFICAARA